MCFAVAAPVAVRTPNGPMSRICQCAAPRMVQCLVFANAPHPEWSNASCIEKSGVVFGEKRKTVVSQTKELTLHV